MKGEGCSAKHTLLLWPGRFTKEDWPSWNEITPLYCCCQIHSVPWNVAIKACSACCSLWLLRTRQVLTSPPSPYLEEPLLLSHLRLSGPHRVLRQRHWRQVRMCGSQYCIDSSTHQRALLKGLMIQSGKEYTAGFRPKHTATFLMGSASKHITHIHRKALVFNHYLYNSNAIKVRD